MYLHRKENLREIRKRKKVARETKYSIEKELREKDRINDEFLLMLHTLTLEEIIALKLESVMKTYRTSLPGLPLFANMRYVIQAAVVRASFALTTSLREAGFFLGKTKSEMGVLKRFYYRDYLQQKYDTDSKEISDEIKEKYERYMED